MENALVDYFDSCPGLLFIADSAGQLTRVSKALGERLGARAAVGRSIAALAVEDDRARVEASLAEYATNATSSWTIEFHVPEADRRLTRVRLEGARGPGETLHGVLHVVKELAFETALESKVLRSIVETLDIVAWAVDPDGRFIYHDGKALATAGLKRRQFLGLNIFELYPSENLETIRSALAGTPSHRTAVAHEVHWESWNIPVKNEEDEVEYIVGISLDVSESARTEAELKRQLETIQQQQRAIQELSAPLIEVWDRVLTVPLVGVIDSKRTNDLIERLLGEVSRAGARFAILDLTGVEALDTATTSHLLRLLSSLRLLGAEGMITGISPYVAQTMVGLGVDLGAVTTRRNLRDGLRYCMEIMDS